MTRRTAILAGCVAGVGVTGLAFVMNAYDRYAPCAHWIRLIGRALLLLPLCPVLMVEQITGVPAGSKPLSNMLASNPWLAIWDGLAYSAIVLALAVAARKMLRPKTGGQPVAARDR